MQRLLNPIDKETKEGEAFKAFFTAKYFLSNHFVNPDNPIQFTLNDVSYECTEKFYFQAMARFFGQEEVALEILGMEAGKDKGGDTLGKLLKKRGNKLREDLKQELGDKVPHMWKMIAHIVMGVANWLKYTQNEALAEALLATGDAPLVEASPTDSYWGVGFDVGDPNILDPANWGQNMMGRVLVCIRQHLAYRRAKDESRLKVVSFTQAMETNANALPIPSPVAIANMPLQRQLLADIGMVASLFDEPDANPWLMLRTIFAERNREILVRLLGSKRLMKFHGWARSYLDLLDEAMEEAASAESHKGEKHCEEIMEQGAEPSYREEPTPPSSGSHIEGHLGELQFPILNFAGKRVATATLLFKDITRVGAEAIVNASKNTLVDGRGVDGAIHAAAGPELRAAVERIGRCETGETVVTDAYALKDIGVKVIIHTVGPEILPKGRRALELEEEQLYDCYWNALNRAESLNLNSIAFPCISTGKSNFSHLRAAEIALSALRDWVASREDMFTYPTEIIFCTFTSKDYHIYEEGIPEILMQAEETSGDTHNVAPEREEAWQNAQARAVEQQVQESGAGIAGLEIRGQEEWPRLSQPSAAQPQAAENIGTQPSYSDATMMDNAFPRYMICQQRRDFAIGVQTQPDRWPDWEKYVGFLVEPEDIRPPNVRYQIGQIWEVQLTEPREGYKQLEERETSGGSFQQVQSEGEGRHKPVLHEDSINCQAFCHREDAVFIQGPVSKEVIAVVGRKRFGREKQDVLVAYASQLVVPMRVEAWNTQDFNTHEAKEGDRLVLRINKGPNGCWIGPRYMFPPGATYHSVKDKLAGDNAWVGAYAREYKTSEWDFSTMSLRDKVDHERMLFVANTLIHIDEQDEEERKFTIETKPRRQDDGNVSLYYEKQPVSKADRDFLIGLLERWKIDEQMALKQSPHGNIVVAGRIVDRRLSERGGVCRATITVKLFETPAKKTSMNVMMKKGNKMYAIIPSQTFRFRRLLEFLNSEELIDIALSDSPRGSIVRKLLGLEGQTVDICPEEHVAYAKDHLNEKQLQVTNMLTCLHRVGQLVANQAPFGTGKTRGIIYSIIQHLIQSQGSIVTLLCAMNRLLLTSAAELMQALREANVDKIIMIILSRHGLEEHGDLIDSLGLRQYICTLDHGEDGDIKVASNKDILERVNRFKPSVIFATPDKATMIPEAFESTTQLIADEVGKMQQVIAVHLAASMPKLLKFLMSADVKQPTTSKRTGPYVRERSGFASILDLVMNPLWRTQAIEYEYSYRTHPLILADLSRSIYGGRLRSGITVEDRRVFMDCGINLPIRDYPVILLDNQCIEGRYKYSTSCHNVAENEMALRILGDLYRARVDGRLPLNTTIGIMCYYQQQVEFTYDTARNRGIPLSRDDIHTVDGFVGGQWDIVIMLTSMTSQATDFLLDDKRATAAWTRQKHGLIVIANFRVYADHGRVRDIVREVTSHTPILGSWKLESADQACAYEFLWGEVQRTEASGVFHANGFIPLARNYGNTFNTRWGQEQYSLTHGQQVQQPGAAMPPPRFFPPQLRFPQWQPRPYGPYRGQQRFNPNQGGDRKRGYPHSQLGPWY